MSALNFEPRRRRPFSPATLVARLVVVGAIAVVLTVYIWGVWPGATRPTTQPISVPVPPVRPIPSSLPALSAVDETVLAEVRDGEAVRERPYYFLLKRAVETPPPVEARGLRVEAEQLMTHPGTFRGRLVCVRGVFLRESAVDLPANLAGVREARQGEIGSVGGTLVTFVLPQAGATGARLGDDVELTGYFLQVRQFQSGADGEAHTGPVVLGVTLTHSSRREPVPVGWIIGLVVSVILVIGLVAVVNVARQRRAQRRRAAHAARRRPSS